MYTYFRPGKTWYETDGNPYIEWRRMWTVEEFIK